GRSGSSTAYPFLSDEWMTAARAIYEAHRGEATAMPVSLKANLNITDVPFGDGPLKAHLDTSSGELEVDLGHLETADVTLTMGYDTAKAQIVTQDQQAVMQAFMGGRIKIEGDMSKLMGLAAASASGSTETQAVAQRIAAEIQTITE
ncbi:MAG: SCP2 sterol-binding domain-containing protein, partial [Acidimicrobiales bacterium]